MILLELKINKINPSIDFVIPSYVGNKMANKDCISNENETNVSVIESDISTPSQDSDRTTMAISSNSDEHKCIPGPVVTSVVTQTSSTGTQLAS